MKFNVIIVVLFICNLSFGQKVRTSLNKVSGLNSESYQSVTFNGSWSWFSEPRAVYYEGEHQRTYMGWIDNWGDIVVGYYDHKTLAIKTHVIAKNIKIDDHINPSLLLDENGRLIVTYKLHMSSDMPLYLVKAKNPEDISEWEETKITDMAQLPMQSAQTDIINNAIPTGVKAWKWDMAEDTNGNPVIAYSKYPNDTTQIYCYARWDGKKWQNFELINSGSWVPKTPEGKTEPQPNYYGGMSIDKEDPNILYLSVKRDSVFEIEKWVTSNGGRSWKIDFITNGSSKDNVRPFAVRNAKAGNPVQLLWMQNTRYTHLNATNAERLDERFHSSIKMDVPSPVTKNPLAANDIESLMRRVADWQLANPTRDHLLNWHYAAFFVGLMDFYDLTGEDRYRREMYNIGQYYEWKTLNDILHADRIAIIDMYMRLYEKDKNPALIEKTRWALDIIRSRGTGQKVMVHFDNNIYFNEWLTWCDALFMSPPVFTRMTNITGDNRYTNYMNTMWWKTSDYLYSKADSLYFRDDRYITRLSDNGKKIFWSRGNGWVIGGLARILRDLPKDSPYRPRFEQEFKEMAHKLLSIQQPHGLWTVSLLDPEYLPKGESSGSAFFVYALAYGLNNNLIDAKYRPQVEKAWIALSNNVNQNGRLGYVQQVAGDPYPFYEHQYHVYASGAYLMAGKEMIELVSEQ